MLFPQLKILCNSFQFLWNKPDPLLVYLDIRTNSRDLALFFHNDGIKIRFIDTLLIMEKDIMFKAGKKSILMTSIVLGLSASTLYADDREVTVEMFAPEKGHKVGIDGKGWFIDLEIEFESGLTESGFTGLQLTGPGVHDNAGPFPGTFSPGVDDRLPGLIVLVSTTTIGGGSCQNLANLFNLTGITNIDEDEVEIWDTWIVGAPLFGRETKSKTFVAVASDHNGDGIYNDAPAVLPDANGDGKCNVHDLKAFGIASNIAKTKFYIN